MHNASRPASDAPTQPTPAAVAARFTRKVLLKNPGGLHMRPASILVSLSRQLGCQVCVRREERLASAASLMDLLLLGVEAGTEIDVEVEGPEAGHAIAVISDFLASEDMDNWQMPEKTT